MSDSERETASVLMSALLGVRWDSDVVVFGRRLASELERMGYMIVPRV